MSAGSTQRMFHFNLDPLTGNSEWVVIEEDDALEEDSHRKPLLANNSYLDMLNDTPRNRAYRRAIEKILTKPCHVLDIGAGTGLLSMMAARAIDGVFLSSSSAKGTAAACESYLPMVKLMRKVLHANGMERKVRIINKRSDELEVGVDINSCADFLVSEILDSELLGEGLIPTLQHAHDNLLVENPQSVPYRTTIFMLVESAYLWKLHDLYNNEAKVSYDIRLVPKGMETLLGVKPQQFALHCDALRENIKLLSEPFKVFEFDFCKRPDTCGRTELQIKATNDDNVHVVISWWILQLDSEGEIYYSTAPKWIGQSLEMNELQPSFPSAEGAYFMNSRLKHRAQRLASMNPALKFVIRSLSPERIAIHGDNNWRDSLLIAIRNAVDLLIGEPFYYGSKGRLPWKNLRFWHN